MVNAVTGPFDMTLTFLETDATALGEGVIGPHAPRLEARVQVVMALGHAKSMIPLLVQAVSQYEQQFGVIPAPGFDEDSKS